MRIKLDENVTAAALALLADHGHDVDTVPSEGLTGAKDAVLMAVCRSDSRMLVTFDVGFGDVRTYPPGSHPGIVLLRIPDQRPDNTLVVVSDTRVRIRRTAL